MKDPVVVQNIKNGQSIKDLCINKCVQEGGVQNECNVQCLECKAIFCTININKHNVNIPGKCKM